MDVQNRQQALIQDQLSCYFKYMYICQVNWSKMLHNLLDPLTRVSVRLC